MENNYQNNSIEQNEEQGFDITLFLLECLSKWKWFVLSLFIVIGLAGFYILCQVPSYKVDSLILIIDKWSKTEGDVLTQSLGITSGADNIITEIQVMRSRTITKKIVNDLELHTRYEYEGGLRNTPLYNNTPIVVKPDTTTDLGLLLTGIDLKITRPGDKNSYDIKGKYTMTTSAYVEGEEKEIDLTNVQLPHTLYLPTVGTFIIEQVAGYEPLDKTLLVNISNPNEVAINLSKDLALAQFEKTAPLISASYTTPLPQMGIDIINRMVYYYNQEGIAEKNLASTNTEAFITNRLVSIQKELSDVEENVEQYRTQRGLTDLSSEAEIYLKQTSESDKERSRLDVQMNLIEYVESFLANPENTYAPIPILGIDEGGMSNLITEYNKAVAERERLLNSSSESNPVIKEISQNIMALKSTVLQGIAATRKSIELSKQDLARQDAENERKIRNVPQYERELTDIMRQQRIKENLYVFLLEKREENALTQTLAVGDARIIDEPTPGLKPVAPKKAQIALIAFVLAMLIPAAIIYIKGLIFPSFHDKVELEKLTQIPVLSEIPNCNKDEFFVVKEKSNNTASELFRLLRNNLQFTLTSPDKKVIMVTSSVSGEGKTFISSNLATAFAHTGKKVLIIGLDIRRPMAALHFGFDNKKGITNYLSGQETNVDNIIQPTHTKGLDIIPGGPVPPNPNELLLTKNLDNLIAEMRNRYDIIIIDSAPVGMVSDSFLIDRVIDTTLFVTRSKYTSRSHVKNINAYSANGRLKSLYLCINAVDMTTRTYSYRRYGYGYGYGYGSYGYGDDSDKSKKKSKKSKFPFMKEK